MIALPTSNNATYSTSIQVTELPWHVAGLPADQNSQLLAACRQERLASSCFTSPARVNRWDTDIQTTPASLPLVDPVLPEGPNGSRHRPGACESNWSNTPARERHSRLLPAAFWILGCLEILAVIVCSLPVLSV